VFGRSCNCDGSGLCDVNDEDGVKREKDLDKRISVRLQRGFPDAMKLEIQSRGCKYLLVFKPCVPNTTDDPELFGYILR
jgi:hypothetical protein